MNENQPSGRIEGLLHAVDRALLRRRLFLWRATGGSLATVRRIDRMTRRGILIGGCGRSGTTVLQGLLSCHPQIFAVDIETGAFCPTAYTAEPDYDAPLELARVYRRLVLDGLPDGVTRWSEKTPKNVRYARRALKYLGPGARFLHIVRDGRDVVTSRHFRAPERYWVSPERWIQDVRAGRELEGHPQVHTLRYEDLVRSLESTLRSICEFVDLPFDDRFLGYPETARVRQIDGWAPRLRPVSEKAIGKWRKPEHAEIVAELMADDRAVELLEHYGYLETG